MISLNVTSFVESTRVKSFLFECAKYWASEGNHVCYISHREQQDLPPSLQGTENTSYSYAQFVKITFVTAPNFNSLTNYLINVQKSTNIPKVLIVEDITSYTNCSESPESDFPLLCSLLKHTGLMCSRFHGSEAFLILSVEFEAEKLNVINLILSPMKTWRALEKHDSSLIENFTLQEITSNPISRILQKFNFSYMEKKDGQFLRLNNVQRIFEESYNFNNKVF